MEGVFMGNKKEEYQNAMKLRAHHLLCLQGFQGYGYDEGFTENMKRILEIIANDKDKKIRIIDYCDDICELCPNNRKGICKDKCKVDFMDKQTLSKLKIESGYEIEAQHLFLFANKYIQSKKDKEEICNSCSWKQVCLWFQKK